MYLPIHKISRGIKEILSGCLAFFRVNKNDVLFWVDGRDWQVDFGPVAGVAGTITTLTVAPQCLFRGEKIIATDSWEKQGFGTRVWIILIGQRLQRPAGCGATLTAFYANNSLGNGVKWDPCDPALLISMTVSFVETCTFDATVFGRAVL
jgi:hypothetical protein